MASANKRRTRRQSRRPQNAVPLRNPNATRPTGTATADSPDVVQGALFPAGQLIDPESGARVVVDDGSAERESRPSPTREAESERNLEARRRARQERREEARRRRAARNSRAIRLRNPRS